MSVKSVKSKTNEVKDELCKVVHVYNANTNISLYVENTTFTIAETPFAAVPDNKRLQCSALTEKNSRAFANWALIWRPSSVVENQVFKIWSI